MRAAEGAGELTRAEVLSSVRKLLSEKMDEDRDRANRVAVYAVAAAERLGIDDDRLFNLRCVAQVGEVPFLQPLSREEDEVLAAAAALDALLHGVERQAAKRLRESEFPSRVVEALLAVEQVIHPMGA